MAKGQKFRARIHFEGHDGVVVDCVAKSPDAAMKRFREILVNAISVLDPKTGEMVPGFIRPDLVTNRIEMLE